MPIIRSTVLIIVINLCFTINTYAQTLTWAKSMGGTSSDYGKSITTDASNNVYTAGYFTSTVDFDPGAGTNNVTSAGNTDIFIQKLDASGNFVWVKTIGVGNADQAHSITLDASGNIYVTGQYQGSVDFDPGVGTTTLTSTGGTNVFVLKLDASGNFVWARSLGNGASAISCGRGIAVDVGGNVIVTGNFTQTSDFDPGAGTVNLSSGGVTSDVFVCKLDASGIFLWAKRWGVAGNQDFGYAVGVDASGSVYTTGDFNGTVDFNPGAGTYTITSSGSYDGFISKLDASGNFLWVQRWGTAATIDRGHSVKCDGSNLYVGGRGDYAYAMKLNAGTGAFIWTKTLGSSSDLVYGIAYDGSGNVYTTGSFIGTGDFDPGAGVYNLTAVGGQDIFFCKLDASGNFLCAYNHGGSGADEGYGIAVDASNNVYTTGYFSNTVDFDPDATTYNLTYNGNFDIYITKTIGCPVVIVLPIELAYFEAVCNGNEININWATYSQTNNKFFTIERSTDGVTFEAIAMIEGLNNWSQFKQYNVIDRDHPSGILYYRLKQTDFNGQYKYYNIEYVNSDCSTFDEEYSIYPNPVGDKLNLKFKQKEQSRLSYSIYNTLGNLIREEVNILSENENYTIDASNFPNGFYVLNFTYGSINKTIKFIKQ